MISGQHSVLPWPLPRPQTSEEGGSGHHEQHPPYLQYQVLNDQEGVDEGSKTEKWKLGQVDYIERLYHFSTACDISVKQVPSQVRTQKLVQEKAAFEEKRKEGLHSFPACPTTLKGEAEDS